MCGISGYSGTAPKRFLEQAVAVQSHRGPDANMIFEAPSVGLGHNRLAIIDLSPEANQPMTSEDRQHVIVFNGEIYNFLQLRKELENEGATFKSHSDTEVLLHLFKRHGLDFLDRLNGIFALAIWDTDTRSLFVATDRMGVKPLYYIATEGLFAFASELKALTPLSDRSLTPKAAAIIGYLSYLWSPTVQTLAADIKRLAPGHALIVREGTIERQRCWHRSAGGFSTKFQGTVKDAISETRCQLKRAVHRQMLSDVPVGAFLSGGLDSSAIVAFAREIDPNIPCFTIKMKGGQDADQVDDLPYARRVADHLQVPLTVVEVSADTLARDVENMVCQLDEPLADPAALNVQYICRQARKAGIPVLLSGTGGDDLFSGYRRHQAMQLERYLSWVPKNMRSFAATRARELASKHQRYRRVGKLLENADKSADDRLVSLFRWGAPDTVFRLLTPDFRASIDRTQEDPLHSFLATLSSDMSPLSKCLALEQNFFLPNHNLIYTDKMSMAESVEVRVPFLDNDLITFAQSLPDSLRIRGTQAKWVLKKAMEHDLPRDVIYRPKTGFGVPLRRWMTHDLKPLLDDTLSYASLKSRAVFDPEAVHDLIARNNSGKVDASYTLFSVLCIELWMRKFRP